MLVEREVDDHMLRLCAARRCSEDIFCLRRWTKPSRGRAVIKPLGGSAHLYHLPGLLRRAVWKAGCRAEIRRQTMGNVSLTAIGMMGNQTDGSSVAASFTLTFGGSVPARVAAGSDRGYQTCLWPWIKRDGRGGYGEFMPFIVHSEGVHSIRKITPWQTDFHHHHQRHSGLSWLLFPNERLPIHHLRCNLPGGFFTAGSARLL